MIKTTMGVISLASRVRARFSRMHYSVSVQHHTKVREDFNRNVRIKFPDLASRQQLYKARTMGVYGEGVREIFRFLVPKGAMLNFNLVRENGELDQAESQVEHRSEAGVLHVSIAAPTKKGHVLLGFDLNLTFFSREPSDSGLQTVDAIRQTLLHTLTTAAQNWE